MVDSLLEPTQDDLVVTGSSEATLLFGSVAPKVTARDVTLLASLLVDRDPVGTSERSSDVQSLVLDVDLQGAPWQQGYDLAEAAIDKLGAASGAWVDVEQTLTAIGVRLTDVDLDDYGVRAVSLVSTRHSPVTAVNTNYYLHANANVRRFTLAHELCHLLFDSDRGAELAIASGRWAPRELEQRADAFAAMFLMPRELMQRAVAALTEPLDTVESITTLAERLRVSGLTMLYHLKNLGYYDEQKRDFLLHELGDAGS